MTHELSASRLCGGKMSVSFVTIGPESYLVLVASRFESHLALLAVKILRCISGAVDQTWS